MDRRLTYNGVRPGSPRLSFMTLQSLPQCHAAFSTILFTLAWIDQSPVSQPPRSNPHQDVPSTTVTASHVTQGRVRIHDTLRYGRGVGFMGGDGKTYYVIFKLETKLLYQKLCQGNRFAKIVRIGDLPKFTNYQKYFRVINIYYVYLMCKKDHNMYIVIDFRYQIY